MPRGLSRTTSRANSTERPARWMTLANASAAVVLRIPCEPMKAIFALRGQGTCRCYSLGRMTTHRDRYPIRVGALLWPQQTDWAQLSRAPRASPTTSASTHCGPGTTCTPSWATRSSPIYEGWTTLAAWAAETSRIELGLMVGANTFRNPGLTAKSAVTVDHISEGRTWLGLGGAWFEYEHTAAGIDFGSGFGQRLDWLDEAVAGITGVLGRRDRHLRCPTGAIASASSSTSPCPSAARAACPDDRRWRREEDAAHGRRATPRAGTSTAVLETLTHKAEVLRRHCEAVGRDPLEIEHTWCASWSSATTATRPAACCRQDSGATTAARTFDPSVDFVGSEEQVADAWRRYLDLGFTHLVVDVPSPFDRETIERLPRLRELVAAS